MSEASCFHNLREGGIERELAAGVLARVFSGVNVIPSDLWQTPRYVPHGGRTLDSRCVVLDIFAPPREEYRQDGRGLGSATLAR